MQEAYLVEYKVKKKTQKPYNPGEDEEIERHTSENGGNAERLKSQARTAPITRTRPDRLFADNTDVSELKPGAKGRRNLRRILKSYGRNPDNTKRILKQRREGNLEPTVIHNQDGHKTVVAGNTRLSAGKVYRFSVPSVGVG
jgi:hypothetical protein